jgi:hypothetical protein
MANENSYTLAVLEHEPTRRFVVASALYAIASAKMGASLETV